MKFLKAFLLSSFVASGLVLSAFGMEQDIAPLKTTKTMTPQMIQNSANGFFEYLISLHKVNFVQSDKDIIVRLFSACQDNNVPKISKVVTILNQKDNANELVCATLFFATYNCSDIVAQNLLAKKPLRKFIFKAFLPDVQTNSLLLLQETVRCCVQIGHFDVLVDFLNKILLKTPENDKYKELPQGWKFSKLSDFIDNRKELFEDALKIAKERKYKKLLSSLQQFNVSVDNSESDGEECENDEDSSGSDADEENSAECSSDKDSDGECYHTRGERDYAEYKYEHQDQ